MVQWWMPEWLRAGAALQIGLTISAQVVADGKWGIELRSNRIRLQSPCTD